jgi:peptidyl-prolyl cis-trans isomerase A (cyclophilin A)
VLETETFHCLRSFFSLSPWRARPDDQPQAAVKVDVIQAGVAEVPGAETKDEPIPLERTRDTRLSHVDGALSMARGAPDTATSDFFICVGTQPSLDFGGKRNPDGQGFAVFGRVTGGSRVVRRIHESATGVGALVNGGNQALMPPIRILRIRRK